MTTNYERIKNMTVDEMAEHLHKVDYAIWVGAKLALHKKGIELEGYSPENSIEGLKKWLLSEVVDDEGL